MNISELISIIILVYAACGALVGIMYTATPDWDKYEFHEFMIAWPVILVGLFIKTVIKVFTNVKE